MSQRIIVKCDRCGATAETNEEKNALNLQEVAVGIKKYSYSSYSPSYQYFQNQLKHQQQWCWKCCEQVGFIQEKIPVGETEKPKPTLEEIIREFIGTVVQDYLPNQ